MQQHIKYLVVEDQPAWSQAISAEVRTYFEVVCRLYKARITAASAYDGDQGSEQLENNGFDLVTLDMNLGEGASNSKISGLDLLGEIAAGNRAFFVIIITGAVTDPNLERIYGKEAAALMRYGALNEAVKQLPAERVRIVHKPNLKNITAAIQELAPHLRSALDQYASISRERNIFRPMAKDSDFWEIRYNGGPRMTLPFVEPYRTIQSALAQPNRMLKVTELIQKLAHSSGKGGVVILPEYNAAERKQRPVVTEYQGHQGDEVSSADGLDWAEMGGFGVSFIHSPVETKDGVILIESFILGLLDVVKLGMNMKDYITDLIGMGVDEVGLLSIPRAASEWASKSGEAIVEFGVADASNRLMQAVKAIVPHLEPIKERWLKRKKPDGTPKPKSGTKKIRVVARVDTPEMLLARQHWSRFKKNIEARPALVEFYKHIVTWIPRDPTTRGHLYYRPPGGGELCPFWLTE